MANFGYRSYNDALKNGVHYTVEELKQLKNGDKVLVLDIQNKDDDYSLSNRLFEEEVRVADEESIIAGSYELMYEELFDDSSQGEYCSFLKPKTK